MTDKCERERSRMTPRFLAWANERMELPFTEMRKIVGAADVEWGLGSDIGSLEFSFGHAVKSCFQEDQCEM